MINAKFLLIASLFISVLGISQEKKSFYSNETYLLKNMIPNDKVDFWCLIENKDGKTTELKIVGKKKDFEPQSSGFTFEHGDSFLYIIYGKNGTLNYITKKEDLKSFIGKIDNLEEATLLQLLDGYQIDYEYKNIAGNYHEDANSYFFFFFLITSKECHFQKKHFTITIDKKMGTVSSIEDNGSYYEIYQKNCKNNPRLLKLKEKYEKENPKEEHPRRR